MIVDKEDLKQKLEMIKLESKKKQEKIEKIKAEIEQLSRDVIYTQGKIDFITGFVANNVDGERIEDVRKEPPKAVEQ